MGASRNMLAAVEEIARDIGSPDGFSRMKGRVEAWAADHPIETVLLTRESTAPLTAAALGPMGGGAFAAVGNMADEVNDLSARISVYSELLPKQIRWQAALLLSAESGGTGIIQTLQNVERITAFLDSVPQVISAERTAAMRDITAERIAVMLELDEMLAATLQAIDQERLAVMQGITAERIATLEELDPIASRLTELAVDQAMSRINTAIDHSYWRAVQLIGALLVLFLVGGAIFFRFIGRRRMVLPV
ncbi:MAG: hypothetical protein JSV86_17940 [Gemmatimonadota bacterium]|nr:MAG: hypothetical protein JSV86_17940 [Gemmatimonadota bacterium]